MSSFDRNTPVLSPPEGQVSNFDNPTTLMPAVIATAVLVYLLTTITVAARLFIKAYLIGVHNIEDILSYFAWAGLMTYTSLLVYIENFGLARHMWDVRLVELPHMLFYVNILYCIYGPSTAAAKLSVLFQIKRIFASTSRNLVYWVVVLSIILNSIFYLGLSLSYIFQCLPREKIWNATVKGKCVNSNSSNLAAGILNLISDTEALLLPAWAIWHLNMPIRRKLNAFAIFAVGSLACIIGIGGIYVRVLVLRSPDFTWLGTKLAMLVIAEMAVVIAVGCSPVLPRLYHYLRGPARGPGTDDGVTEGKAILTIGGSGGSKSNVTKKARKGGALGSTLAKYMGPGGMTGMTTLGSRATIAKEDDQVELTPYETINGVRRTVEIDQESTTQEDRMHGRIQP